MSNLITFPSLSYCYDFTESSVVKSHASSDFTLGAGLIFFVRDEEIMGLFGSEINSLHLDWIDVAIAVYVADRLSLREKAKCRNNWKRHFQIKIAVRNLAIWTDQEVYNELRTALNHFTDDEWDFEFVRLSTFDRLDAVNNKLSLPPKTSPRVALFSGGLDSFAGLAQQLQNDRGRSFILVSGATNSRQTSQQRKQISELRAHFPSNEIIHQKIDFGFAWNGVERPKEESSQRTRGFLFTTLGAVTALNVGAGMLEIYENGIGAINIPYDGSQVGTMSSRAVNPLSLLRMEKFIRKLTSRTFLVKNLFLFHTKGEMCGCQSVRDLARSISLTFSCDGFPVQTIGKPQCGVCTSCLLRRMSIESADLANFDRGETYLTDLTSAISTPSFLQLNHLRAMEWQYHILANYLSAKNPWANLIIKYPMLQLILLELTADGNSRAETIRDSILRLYIQYCAEWENFSARNNHINPKSNAA